MKAPPPGREKEEIERAVADRCSCASMLDGLAALISHIVRVMDVEDARIGQPSAACSRARRRARIRTPGERAAPRTRAACTTAVVAGAAMEAVATYMIQ
jgi:hypothetical protein